MLISRLLLLLACFALGKAFMLPAPSASNIGALRLQQRSCSIRPTSPLPPAKSSSIMRMAEGGGKTPNDDKKKGQEVMGEVEKNFNYVIDLVTVSIGAGVLACLLLNLAGKVPCI